MYITRSIEPVIIRAVGSFKVVLITGGRQVGKSTTLHHLYADSNYEYVTLDDRLEREIAEQDPGAFFLNHPGRLIIDEIQYAPGLFSEIKKRVDQSGEYGQYILTGSQTLALMAGVSESLAGRVGVLQMGSLSLREILQDPITMPFVPNDAYLETERKALKGTELWNAIHRGSMPELMKNPDLDHSLFYSSYVDTYIERDVRAITNVRDLGLFSRFINVLAARVSQLLNYADIAKELGIDERTVKSWVSILQASGVIILLQPFSNNRLSRVVKTPVLYFMDTGLVGYLLRWTTPETMMSGAMSGPIMENFAISEVVKSFYNAGITNLPISFYRDHDQKEIDLIVESSGVLYPVEIKQTATPNAAMGKSLKIIEKAVGFEVGHHLLLSQVDRKRYLTQDLIAYPVGAI